MEYNITGGECITISIDIDGDGEDDVVIKTAKFRRTILLGIAGLLSVVCPVLTGYL